MTKLFFDQLISLDDIDKEIKKVAKSKEEQEELWQLVDEMVHHRVLGCVLDNLPKENHEEFLVKFHDSPYDEGILDYLRGKIGENIGELIKQEVGSLAFELLEDLRARDG